MPLLANEGGCSFGALAGIQEDRQLADKLKDSGQQKPRAPSNIPSRYFTISVRIRFSPNLRDQELLVNSL
jgi:hypothetical protein